VRRENCFFFCKDDVLLWDALNHIVGGLNHGIAGIVIVGANVL
jgi:hypothetical protein